MGDKKGCKFCNGESKIKSDFYDYYKNSYMTAFTATMKLNDPDLAKEELIVQIDLENGNIIPDHPMLPWTLTFSAKYCIMCGRRYRHRGRLCESR